MKNNKGMTMVEVMVAFVILLIGLAGLYKATLFAGQQVNRAKDVKIQIDQLMEGYYTENDTLVSVPNHKQYTVKFLVNGLEESIWLPKITGVAAEWKDYASADGYHLQSFKLTGE